MLSIDNLPEMLSNGGHLTYFGYLFRARADMNIVNLQGRTPLRIALLEGNLDIAGLLLDNGANIDYIDTDSRYVK